MSHPIRRIYTSLNLIALSFLITSTLILPVSVSFAEDTSVEEFYNTSGRLRARAIYFAERSKSILAYRMNLKDLNERLVATLEADEELINNLSGKTNLSPDERQELESLRYYQVENRKILAARTGEFESTNVLQSKYDESLKNAEAKYSKHWNTDAGIEPCTPTTPEYVDLFRQLDQVLKRDGVHQGPYDASAASSALTSFFENQTELIRKRLRRYLDEENSVRGKLVELNAEREALSAELDANVNNANASIRSKRVARLRRVEKDIHEIEYGGTSEILENIDGAIQKLSETSRMELILMKADRAMYLSRHFCPSISEGTVIPARGTSENINGPSASDSSVNSGAAE